MQALRVTDYDVLADKMPGGRYVLRDYRRNIGNIRFSVLLDMYREAYDTVLMRGSDDECEKIVDRIVGVVCHKDVAITVNKGRFLVRNNGEGPWKCLDEDDSKELTRQTLTATAPILEEEEDDEEISGEFIASTAFSAMHLGPPSPVLPPPPLDTSAFNNDKKRGRRRSLLRRSASESTMMDDKKKLQIRGLGLDTMVSVAVEEEDEFFPKSPMPGSSGKRGSIVSHGRVSPGSLIRHHSEPIIHSISKIERWEGMDVVLTTSGRKLSTDETIIGNNRVKVLVSLHQDGYKTAAPDEKERIADSLVEAVCLFWGGRILLDQGSSYAELSGVQARIAMKNLLDPMNAQTKIVAAASPSEPPSKPLLSAPPVPVFLQEASKEILNESAPKKMQSQAINLLQERKAKRMNAKTLGRMLVNGESSSDPPSAEF